MEARNPHVSAVRTPGTKIVATIGPASLPIIGDLVGAGIDVARINLSHGTFEAHQAAARAVRHAGQAAAHSGRAARGAPRGVASS